MHSQQKIKFSLGQVGGEFVSRSIGFLKSEDTVGESSRVSPRCFLQGNWRLLMGAYILNMHEKQELGYNVSRIN